MNYSIFTCLSGFTRQSGVNVTTPKMGKFLGKGVKFLFFGRFYSDRKILVLKYGRFLVLYTYLLTSLKHQGCLTFLYILSDWNKAAFFELIKNSLGSQLHFLIFHFYSSGKKLNFVG